MPAITSGWINYQEDDGTNVTIKATSVTAAFNGQTVSKFPTSGLFWPYLRRDLRHVIGHSSTGRSAQMTVTDETAYAALLIGTDTFTDRNGTVYTISSKIGEKSNARDAR
jgi:hypothetical protein